MATRSETVARGALWGVGALALAGLLASGQCTVVFKSDPDGDRKDPEDPAAGAPPPGQLLEVHVLAADGSLETGYLWFPAAEPEPGDQDAGAAPSFRNK